MAINKSFWITDDKKKLNKNFWVKEPVKNLASVQTTQSQASLSADNVQSRIAELDNLMRETDLKIRQQAKYTPEERSEFQRQYGAYNKEYQKLKSELDGQGKTSTVSELPKAKSYQEGANLLSMEDVSAMNRGASLTQKLDKALKHDIPMMPEKAVRTAADIYGSAVSGAASAVEGIADFAVGNTGTVLSGVTSGFGLAPNKVSNAIKDRAESFVKKDLGFQGFVDEVKSEGAGTYEPNILGVKVRDIANNIANMLTASRLGGVAGFVMSAGGRSIQEALNEGQGLNRATVYGDISGALEGVTEKLFDAVKLVGGGKLDKFLPKSAIGKLVGGAAGEGIEEMITEGLNPLVKYLTYEKGSVELPSLVEWAQSVGRAGWEGFVIGLLLKGGQDVSDASVREQYKNEVVSAFDKVKGLTQSEKSVVVQEMVSAPERASESLLALPAGNENMAYANNGNIVLGDGTVPKISENVTYDVVNGRQALVMSNASKNDVSNASLVQNMQQPNVTLPTQAEMAQKANMGQIPKNVQLPTQKAEITLQSAKVAGANDINMNKAIELNDLLRSGAEVKFYNPQNIPQGVDASKAKVANGFYSNGTVWINKNTKNAVEVVLGHELTHHLETTDSYMDLANTILDSDVFYDYIAEKGYSNVAEYKQSLGQNYTAEQFDSEMVANFVQDKLFSDQNSIDRLARQNTTLVEKIKNWISDLVVSFKGTAQEKELRKIEGMYRKALEQARNSTATSTETQYSYSGKVSLDNLKSRYDKMNAMQKEFVNELENNYQKALYLSSKGYKNNQILKETGWFESDGKWKWEIPDEYFKLKDNANLSNGEHNLSEIIEHDLVFMVYPELAKQKVVVSDKTGKSFYNTIDDKIYLKIGEKTKGAIELNLLHELQHSIQNIEGFDGGTSTFGGMLRYYKKHGEIEASDTVRRFKQGKKYADFDRENVAPELSKENPKHPMLDKYLAGETEKQTPIRDYLYQKSKEKGNGIYEKVDRKAFGMEVDEADNAKDMRVDNGGRNGRYVNDTAGKEPAFSMPENRLEDRLTGDALLDAQDLIDELKSVNAQIDENGYVTVYHRTDSESANKIYETGKMKAKEDGVFFSTSENGINNSGYGSSVISLKVPVEKLVIDDIFADEASVKIPLKNKNEVLDIKEYIYKASEGTDKVSFSLPEIKQKQLEIIQKSNPVNDDYHTWVRDVSDIKTFEEALQDSDYEGWENGDFAPDYTGEMAKQALKSGKVTVYSSYPIEQGAFVTPSKMEAKSYAGSGGVYSKTVDLRDVAWIDPTQGQYAKVTETDKVSFSLPDTDNQGRSLTKQQQEFFKDSKLKDTSGKLISYYHGTENGGFNTFEYGRQKGAGKALGDGFYFTQSKSQAQTYASTEEGINKSRELLGLPKKEVNPQVYEVYLNAKNPLYLNEYKGELVDKADYIAEKYLNMDTKNDMYRPYKDYAESKLETAISMIDYIKSVAERSGKTTAEIFKDLGYDALVDGKFQTVVFDSNQIKNVDNTNPTSNPDIRYSMNPVDIAKNPPNPQNGLDSVAKKRRAHEGDRISKFAESVQSSSIFSDELKKLASENIDINTYDRLANKDVLMEANDRINEGGQAEVTKLLSKDVKSYSAKDVAEAILLIDRYQQVGDYESAIEIMTKLRKSGTSGGQMIQMFSLLGRMTPEGMTYYAQKELSDAYEEILNHKTQAWADEHADEFKLNDRDVEFIQRRVNQASKLPEGRDKYVLLGEIAERVQRKIPPQEGQSIKALARNSMLLNPKTMVRNVLGNVVIVPNHIISDIVGTGIDKAISKKTGVRTTGIVNAKDMLIGAKKGFYESFDDFRRGISTREVGNDRFEIQNSGRSFNENNIGKFAAQRNAVARALNGLDRVTGYLLESGDRPFYEAWFINSLNNQMKLNNVTTPTAEMIEIATDEALQRTWQDSNTYTKAVSGVRNMLNKFNIKGYGLGDMVMPFVKTPANLTKAVVDFSPLGAINAALKTSQFVKDIGKGMATSKQQREVVKAWSQVITGSLGMAIMTALANAGALAGGSDDDKDVRNFEQNVLGIKPYSIKIGDTSYTYDWAQPLGTSAAIVADTVKSLKNATDNESKVGAVFKGLQSGASVLLDQSFVSSIRNLFEEDNLFNALIETATNEPAKFTPQLLGQVAQVGDDTARISYVYNDKLSTGINKVKAKIPGLRQTLEPNVDVLGREVKTDNSVGNVMFNPANTAFARSTKGAEEMYRVYQSTGDKAVIAQVAPYYFNVGSEKIVLTPKQRTQFQKTIGEIASNGVENLLENKAYVGLPDVDKAEVLKELYSYGNAIAKEEASSSYLLPGAMEKIKNSGMNPEEYILLKYISSSGGTKKDEMYSALISAGYSKKESEAFLSDYKGYKFESTAKSSSLPTLAEQRAKLPSLKK